MAMVALTVQTSARTEFIDVTAKVQQVVAATGVENGLCMLYVPHTTAAVTINESADPSVRADILKTINEIVPWDDGYRHLEGNSAAHIKTTLVGSSEMLMIERGGLVLGTWQGIFFCEFDGPRTRKLHVNLIPAVK
jgi:secondary thiamine-phosphate synthase enzyme